ncbi:MAG TPA: SPFH domain-containing protein [Candidatus Pullilachnospira intestinigallinarum]|nr:SPFH domain-containing protein [Candidatus Pullilachnospira intestinigallinarum]
MGLIKAVKETIGGSLADQWLEVIEPESMGDQTVMTPGIRTGKGANRKGGEHVISNGSVIHVYEGQFMMLLDGGKIVDYSAQPGYFTVDNSSMPSMFSGSMEDVLASSFDRFRYGGATPTTQKVLYINLQEIKGIRFGTRNPISYFDRFYNAELFLRAHGTYSIRIVDPIRFYAEALPKNQDQVEITEINEQYLFEFMEALQACINQLSADGVSISYVPSKSRELSRYMADTLDGEWKKTRGMEIQSVAIASVSYDDQSRKLIQMRNQGAMLQDPSIREGYMQGAVARGMESAGKNPAGSAMGFMGMGMGMQAGGDALSAASHTNRSQMQGQAFRKTPDAGSAADSWICSCGHANTGKFCSECGKPRPATDSWTCSCGQVNTGKFCSECGKPRPAAGSWICACGQENTGKFCSECGKPRP